MGEVRRSFLPELAAEASGKPLPSAAIVLIGAGALGSLLVEILAREQFGRWTIIDRDRLMPHNLAWHALWRESVGLPKVKALAWSLNVLHDDEDFARPIGSDVIDQGPHMEAVEINSTVPVLVTENA